MLQSAVIRDEFAFTGHNAALTAVCFNRQQDCFVSADDSSLRLWRPVARSLRPPPQAQAQAAQRIVSLPPRTANFVQALECIESRQLYVAAALDGTFKLFDAGLSELASVFTRRAAVLSLAFDAKRGRLLSGGVDGCAAWQVRGRPAAAEAAVNAGYELAPLPGFFRGPNPPTPASDELASAPSDAWVRRVQLSADATRVFAQSARHVDVFAAADGAFIERHADLFPSEYGSLSAFAPHERSKYLVCGTSAGAIFVLSARPTTVVHAFKDHTAAVTSLAELAASGLVLSSSLDGSVRLWDLEARRQVHRLDLGQPVQELRLLPGAGAGPQRFCCRVRSAVRIFRIQSTIKEHMACLAPISVLARVLAPRRPGTRSRGATGRSAARRGRRGEDERGSGGGESESESESENSNSSGGGDRSKSEGEGEGESESEGESDAGDEEEDGQVVVAAGTDKTIRLFAGRAANEAPSFTWIPDEGSLDLAGFALHARTRRLFLLLDSQKLLVVGTSAAPDAQASSIERVVSLGGPAPPPALPKLSAGAAAAGPESADASEPVPDARRPSVFRGSSLPEQLLSPSARRPQSPQTRRGSVSGGASQRGKLRCLCVCAFPPVFHAAPPVASLGGSGGGGSGGGLDAGGGDLLAAATQAKWLSRSLSVKRQASLLLQRTKRPATAETGAEEEDAPERQSRPRRARLVQSEWEWVACGSEHGHLLFWHTGLGDSDADAISIEAHDAAVEALAASQASALLASLDAGHRVHLWQLQPALALRHLLDLRDKPSCLALSPRSDLLLAGFGDGRVLLTDASDLARVETFPAAPRDEPGGCDADDQQHAAMVSAADFLDERRLVLTASVDAVVKIWDQRRSLLRQVAVSAALTSLCFMNARGDVMAGLPAGIFVLSRHDVLPDQAPASGLGGPRRRRQQGRGRGWPRRGDRGLDARLDHAAAPRPAGAPRASPSPNQQPQQEPPAPPQQQPPQRPEPRPWPEQSAPTARRVVASSAAAAAAISRLNDRPLAAASLLVPVARPPRGPEDAARRLQAGELRACAPASARAAAALSGGDRDGGGDRDWRDSLLPACAWRRLLDRQGAGWAASPGASPGALPARGRRERLALVSPRAASRPAAPAQSRAAADGPVLFCAPQAAPPTKDKTPRKLWNAIGGEDRRLLALQRGQPPMN